MKLAIIAYIPPERFGCSKVFFENITKFKTRHKLYLFTDHTGKWPKPVFSAINPPEAMEHHLMYNEIGQKRPAAISNMVWHCSLRILKQDSITHFIYLESDCRVKGDYWDEPLFDEFFTGFPAICGGTVATFNPANGGYEYYRRWTKMMADLFRGEFPVTVYGAPPIEKDPRTPSLFVNGACGVYDLAWMLKFFDPQNPVETTIGKAWDYAIGDKIYSLFGLDSFDMVRQINSVYSGFSDNLTTEEQRLAWLNEGKCRVIHQVKSNRTIE